MKKLSKIFIVIAMLFTIIAFPKMEVKANEVTPYAINREYIKTNYILISESEGNTDITDGFVYVRVDIVLNVVLSTSQTYQSHTVSATPSHYDGSGYYSVSAGSIRSSSVNQTNRIITVKYRVVTRIYNLNNALVDTVTTDKTVYFNY